MNQLKPELPDSGPLATSVLLESWSCGGREGSRISPTAEASEETLVVSYQHPQGSRVSRTPRGPAISLSLDSEDCASIVKAFLCCLF